MKKRYRTHQKIGCTETKLLAFRDITEDVDDFYTQNYVSVESKVWQLLKNFNPIVFRINTSIL